MRKYLTAILIVTFVASVFVGAVSAGVNDVPIYCDCDCIDGKMYICCNEFQNGQWIIVCEPGCRKLHWGCTELP